MTTESKSERKKTLQFWLKRERRAWINSFDAKSGSSGGAFRDHVNDIRRDPMAALVKVGVNWAEMFERFAAGDAADKAWRAPPEQPSKDPDLFSEVNGRPMEEFLTRTTKAHGSYIDSDTVKREEHETFEKVNALRAKPADADSHATIKERKAIEAAAAANESRKIADDLFRRSSGDPEERNEDLIDGKWKKPKAAE